MYTPSHSRNEYCRDMTDRVVHCSTYSSEQSEQNEISAMKTSGDMQRLKNKELSSNMANTPVQSTAEVIGIALH